MCNLEKRKEYVDSYGCPEWSRLTKRGDILALPITCLRSGWGWGLEGRRFPKGD